MSAVMASAPAQPKGVTFDRCQHCHRESSPTHRIRACTRCFSVGYCSKACQKADWPGRDGHRTRCRPRSGQPGAVNSAGTVRSSSAKVEEVGGDGVVRLEVKRGDGGINTGEEWEDLGPISLIEGMANAKIDPHTTEKGVADLAQSIRKNTFAKSKHRKSLPRKTLKILGPESTESYKYMHSPDLIDENLLVFLHGAGGTHLPFDSLGRRMELPQTATLSVSASISSEFVKLPFGLGYTWFEEMDYDRTGEALPAEHPHRLKSLGRAVELLDSILCSLSEMDSDDGGHGGWIPERIFLFGFSAGACLAMELCRARMERKKLPLGGAVCVAGGIRTEGGPPGSKKVEGGPARQCRPTDVLILAGSKDSVFAEEAAVLAKRSYGPSSVRVHVQRGKGHSMIESEGEMRPVMEFLSKRMTRRMPSMEGCCT